MPLTKAYLAVVLIEANLAIGNGVGGQGRWDLKMTAVSHSVRAQHACVALNYFNFNTLYVI